jgi:hypothetical protein
MKEFRSEIEIRASAERVWQVLTDFASFPQWNPFMRRASGEVKAGARLEVRSQPSGANGMTFKPTVLKAEPNRELRWLGHLLIRGQFDGSTSCPSSHWLRIACVLSSAKSSPVCWFRCSHAGSIPTRGAGLKR